MSLVFNDTTTYKGLVQEYEKECGLETGRISGSTKNLKDFAVAANLAFDRFWSIAIPASGTWQLDDSNHTDYPIITTNIVSGQRDYSFTVDGSNNLILEIYKVLVADSNGVFSEIDPVDVQSTHDETASFTDGQNGTGVPYRYDKTANAIFLDPIPNYNYANGLKVYINREPSYFTYTDTTKKPGVPGIFQRYFSIRPAMDYARRNDSVKYKTLQLEVAQMEEAIKQHYSKRSRDEKSRITTKKIMYI